MALSIGGPLANSAQAVDEAVFLDEAFGDLEKWEPLRFESIPRHSEYVIQTTASGETYLKMASDRGGSGLVLKKSFDPAQFPIVEWRWRVDQAIRDVDHTKKSGDDYPIRVYLFFEYDGTGLSFGERMRYRAYRALRGEYPPHSALAYVWTPNPVPSRIFPNPYSSRVNMLVLRGEAAPLGKWKTERIHLLEDYREAFGAAPPETPLRIAIMTDSDDSGQQTAAALDYLRIFAE